MSAQRETRCTWVAPSEDPAARYLIPGCWERVQDWDADCTCKTSAEELNELTARIAGLEARLDQAHDRYSSLHSAVLKHADSAALFVKADGDFREWRRMKAEVRKQDNPSKEM